MEGHFTTLAMSILPNYMSNLSMLNALSYVPLRHFLTDRQLLCLYRMRLRCYLAMLRCLREPTWVTGGSLTINDASRQFVD